VSIVHDRFDPELVLATIEAEKLPHIGAFPTQMIALLEHPTRGLDIESAIWIWGKLKERCKQGTSIIFTSADLEEILQYSDRILVFYGGKVSPPLDAESTTVEQLGQLIGGKGF
jgi:simple sugar transport system ATP-binding protein